MSKAKFYLSDSDQYKFKAWLQLDINSITWEGRYTQEFDLFWETLFPANIELENQVKKLEFCEKHLKTAPLVMWVKWLKFKLICYCFIFKGMSVADLSHFFNLAVNEIGYVLREFFVERFPHLEELFNDHFNISHISSKQVDLIYDEKFEQYFKASDLPGTLSGEIMSALEIMLYKEWSELFEELSKMDRVEQFDLGALQKKISLKNHIVFFKELTVLFIVGGILIIGLTIGNKWYEDYLVKQITLFEPNFFWLDKSLSFRSSDPLNTADVKLAYNQIEELEKVESQKEVFSDQADLRFEEESDVELTSADSLPKDFESAEKEQSGYEENQKGGYRNSQYGGQKAYRVMIASVDSVEEKKRLASLLEIYKVKQADNVKPGTKIPGGIYYNLFVPREFLKEFLTKVAVDDESTILESKTRSIVPANMSKVFIWIKSI